MWPSIPLEHYANVSKRRHRKSKRDVPARLAPLGGQSLSQLNGRRRRSNQYDEGDGESGHDREEWRDHRWQRTEMRPMYICLPQIPLPYEQKPSRRRRHHHRRQHRRSNSSSSSSSTSASSVDQHPARAMNAGLKTQRFHSLQAMARLQRDAARIIQQEYRCFRNRQRNRKHQQDAVRQRALSLFAQLLEDEIVPGLVSEALLDLACEKHEQATQRLGFAEQVYEDFMNSALDELVREIFQSSLDGMLREYMLSRIDLTRASQPPTEAIAVDFFHDLLADILSELIPEVLSDLVNEYFDRQRSQDAWEHDQLRDINVEAVAETQMAYFTLVALSRHLVGSPSGNNSKPSLMAASSSSSSSSVWVSSLGNTFGTTPATSSASSATASSSFASSNAFVNPFSSFPPASTTGNSTVARAREEKNTMMSAFSDLGLALDADGNATTQVSSAKSLLAAKNAEKQEEERALAAHLARKEAIQSSKAKKAPQITALSQALDSFADEVFHSESYLKKSNGAVALGVSRRARQKKEKAMERAENYDSRRGGKSQRGDKRHQRKDKYRHVY
ncbi:hypothetical protein Poli38472_014108 [Pythium oligandrum]|uniref:Uncharacterized protein n=1 Tax=Pythium oligandrum TaxID=41045 RepID=A0A8K1FL58_PYTOL|nr:hypothetical protein Poli38472_014108 [Pythium oligandrum]|eukprot:TMW66796.1 hypothetical protein Poli38472_014108 [Pythium oligandrum]